MVYVGVPESASDPIMSPPLGVQLLATMARRAGHAAEVFDTRRPGDVLERVRTFGPTVVGFSFLSIAAAEAARLAEACRAAGWLTVAGGIHASVFGDALLAGNGGAFDVVVTGEGERAIEAVCAQLAGGTRPAGLVTGIPVASLDDLPFADHFEEYGPVLGDPARSHRTAALQLNRGCPMNCQFCEVSRDAALFELPSNGRRRTTARALDDVGQLVARNGTNYLVLVDSIATLDDRAIAELLLGIDASWPHMSVQLNSHVNKAGTRFLRACAQLRERASVWIGFESGSQVILDLIKKETRAGHADHVAREILGTGARLGVNLLLGLPGETASTRAETMAFAEALKGAESYADQVMLNPNVFNPLPGSPLFGPIVGGGRRRQASGPLGDYRVRTIDDLEAGDVPLHGVDYTPVIEQYRAIWALRGPAADPQYRPWTESG
jgi:anaerobic magnesium-protoporphyrin IX monomethyl ester cyclase